MTILLEYLDLENHFNANYAQKLHQNSGLIPHSFTPPLFPKLFQHNSRTHTDQPTDRLAQHSVRGRSWHLQSVISVNRASQLIEFHFSCYSNTCSIIATMHVYMIIPKSVKYIKEVLLIIVKQFTCIQMCIIGKTLSLFCQTGSLNVNVLTMLASWIAKCRNVFLGMHKIYKSCAVYFISTV